MSPHLFTVSVLITICWLTCRQSAFASSTIDETMPDSIPVDIISDWKAQDGVIYDKAVHKIKSSIPAMYAERIPDDTTEAAYLTACHWRRVARFAPYADRIRNIIYARHHDIGGSVYGYIEDLNPDGAKGLGPWGMTMSKSSNYTAGNSSGTAIHRLEFKNYYPQPTDIITDSKGCLRDPCVSYDGKRIVFAWSKDNNGYHLCDLDVDNPATVRELTADPEGVNVSDCQPCVLPSGDIVFNSSRCFSFALHNLNLVSNLFIMNRDGRYLRRIGYDQVHTFYPNMMEDGRIMYCRMEFNDRNVANCSGIFTMHPDGSRQAGYFGTQSSWPTLFMQSSQIPGSNKTMAIIGGHMGPFAGDLAIIDPSIGRDGSAAVQLIAPKRTSPSGSVYIMDGVDDANKLFQNPLPLDEEWFLISYRKTRTSKFQIYLMNTSGERELIASGGAQSVSQPQLLMPRNSPTATIPYQADYSKTTGELHVANVFTGSGIDTLASKGSIVKLRVVALEYPTDPPFGNTGSSSYQMTPVGRFGCTWNAKRIIGEIKVAADGSAAFFVPARTPVFFQLIDTLGCLVQTMRSWVTLQPGERYECRGCHVDEAKQQTVFSSPIAQTAQPLEPFFNLIDGHFHYPDVIQPVLDANCVKSGCHDASHSTLKLVGDTASASSLGNDEKNAYRIWLRSYYNLSNKTYCYYNCIFGSAEGIAARSLGSPKSKLITTLLAGHKSLLLTNGEIDKLAAWIDLGVPHSGKTSDDMQPVDSLNYEARLDRRRRHEQLEAENIAGFIADGGYTSPAYNQTSIAPWRNEKTTIRNNNHYSSDFAIRFSPLTRRLSLRIPSAGTVSLIDLHGRQIARKTFSTEEALKNAGCILPSTVTTGLYIVKFTGPRGSAQRVVSIF